MTASKEHNGNYEVVVVGASAGGIDALLKVLGHLPPDFTLPVLVVLHLHPHSESGSLVKAFFSATPLPVKEIDDKEPILPGTIYFAPANYHALVEEDRTLALSVDEKVNCSRPSIDVLFESAADAYGDGVVGVLLTGASQDGAAGMKRIKDGGGHILIQDPNGAESDVMPRAAMAACQPDKVFSLDEIGAGLASLGAATNNKKRRSR